MKIHTPWKKSLQSAVTNLTELFDLIELDESARKSFVDDPKFHLLATREFIRRIRKNDPKDPLLLQIVPSEEEQKFFSGFTEDPLLESQINPIPGLLHRYPKRVLLTLTGACPVHCRFCFRRYFPYEENNPLKSQLDKVIDYITQDAAIEEVIYSGGDPLLVSDEILQSVNGRLSQIKHIKRLRIHTRVPIFLPSRINQTFIEIFESLNLSLSFVIHCNHPQELDDEVLEGLQKLRQVGVVLNQAVLLANINDSAATLAELNKKLFSVGVLPYYLHSLDPVAGAAHFAVTEEKGKKIMQQLAEELPGYLVPKYVKVVPSDRHKMQIIGGDQVLNTMRGAF